MSDIVKFDAQYSQWIKDISARFMQSQVKAACKVNVELLKFYWNLGRDISVMNAENNYGTNFYKKLSADLCEALPDVKSFSVTNLKYMKYFYELYPNAENHPQAVDNSSQPEIVHRLWTILNNWFSASRGDIIEPLLINAETIQPKLYSLLKRQ